MSTLPNDYFLTNKMTDISKKKTQVELLIEEMRQLRDENNFLQKTLQMQMSSFTEEIQQKQNKLIEEQQKVLMIGGELQEYRKKYEDLREQVGKIAKIMGFSESLETVESLVEWQDDEEGGLPYELEPLEVNSGFIYPQEDEEDADIDYHPYELNFQKIEIDCMARGDFSSNILSSNLREGKAKEDFEILKNGIKENSKVNGELDKLLKEDGLKIAKKQKSIFSHLFEREYGQNNNQ